MTCPFCLSDNVDFPTVDIGVGEIQCGVAGCEDCHAVQMTPKEIADPELKATAEEMLFGWWKPDVSF